MSKKKLSGKRLVIQFGRYMTQIVLVNGKGSIQHAATVSTPLGAVEDGMIQDMDAVRDMLKEALRVLQGVEGLGICKLNDQDVVRHAMVQRIIKAYEEDEQRRQKK